MNKFLQKQRRWLLPTTLILFLLLVFTFPLVAEFTYSGRSESPDHVLTYNPGKLVWDDSTNIDQNGVAELSLFSAQYDNVEAVDGVNVVAPGTNGYNIVRLKNNVEGSITYHAVLYRIRTNDELPVDAFLTCENAKDAEFGFELPDGVTEENIIRSVTGTVAGKQIQDFDIDWLWLFELEGAVDERDQLDTGFGDLAAEGTDNHVTVGIYIVVEDGNVYTPETGDNTLAGMYIILIAVCGFFMLLLIFGKRRKDEDEEEEAKCRS